MLKNKCLGQQKRNLILALTVFTVVNQQYLERKRKGIQVIPVRTVETKDTTLAICHERGDDWANAVQARILHVHNLDAADAVYHRVCSVNFRTMKQIPVIHNHNCKGNTSKKL